jgi:SagB-type dehydrogenase family enzyme
MTPAPPTTALAYHQATKYTPETIGSHPGLDWGTQPPAFKRYAAEAPIRLAGFLPADPNPFTGEPATREAEAEGGLSLAGLSRLIYAAYGITGVIPQQPRPTYLRAAPSAGGLYPAELYVVVRDFPGLQPGLYGYHPLLHALVLLWEDPAAADALTRACYGNAQVAAAQVSLVVTGVFERSRWRYQERAYRRVLLDSGHLIGNALLVAPELEVRVGLTAAFCDHRLGDLLRLDAAEEGALAVLPVNRPGEAERPAWVALPSPTGHATVDAATLAVLHRDSQCGSDRPRLPALGDEADEALHARYGWTGGISLLGDGLAPNPLFGRIQDTICRRRSTRAYSGEAFTIDQFARILAAAYVPEEIRLHPQEGLVRDLLMTFIAINGVDGLDDGVYYLAPHGLELRLVRRGNVAQALQFLCLGQKLGGAAAAVVFHAADLATAVKRHGDRAYRYLHLDAGILGQRLNLAAIAEELGASGIGGFFDDHVTSLLGIPSEQAVIYVTTLGTPA